jgi:hypothetical protein
MQDRLSRLSDFTLYVILLTLVGLVHAVFYVVAG